MATHTAERQLAVLLLNAFIQWLFELQLIYKHSTEAKQKVLTLVADANLQFVH